MAPVLQLEHIQKYYGNGGSLTKAIQDISFTVERGEFLGIKGHPVPEKQRCSIVFPPSIPSVRAIFT